MSLVKGSGNAKKKTVGNYLTKVKSQNFSKRNSFINDKVSSQVAKILNIDGESLGKKVCETVTSQNNSFFPRTDTSVAANIQIDASGISVAKKALIESTDLLKVSASLNFQKEIEIMKLKCQLQSLQKPQNVDEPPPYKNFENNFSREEMIQIRSIKGGADKDSSFVLQIMKALYKSQPRKLFERSSTGKQQAGRCISNEVFRQFVFSFFVSMPHC